MNILHGVLLLLVVLGVIMTVLAYIGLRVKKKEQMWINKHNENAIKAFEEANKNKKLKRASTPKVPTIKK